MIRFQFHAANQLYPTYHIMYRDVPEQTAAELARSADFEKLGLRQDTAQIRQEDTICRLIYLDETGRELGRIDLESGSFPVEKMRSLFPGACCRPFPLLIQRISEMR